jgi:hypothetical protein
MTYYAKFLKVYGLQELIGINESHENDDHDDQTIELNNVVIEVDDNQNVVKKAVDNDDSFYRKSFWRFPFNILYYLFVITSISWSVVYAVIQAGREKDIRYITSIVFSFLFVIQYFLGMIYYRTGHYRKTMKRNKAYMNYITKGSYFLGVVSFIIAVVAVILLIFDSNINIYTEIYSDASLGVKILMCITLFFDQFYSYGIFFTNLVVFTSVFIIHSLQVRNYTEKLEKNVEDYTEELTIESIIKDYSSLKSQHTKSVLTMNNLFSSITLLGLISAYFMTINFDTKFVGILHYVEIVCFLITECVYIYSISRVKLSVSTIGSIINSATFVTRFLSRSEMEQFAGEFTGNVSRRNTTRSTNDSSKDKNTMMSTLDTSCKTTRDLKKVLLTSRQMTNNSRNKIDLIKDLSMRSVIKNHENAESLDWVVLNDKLGGSWENFKLFGFEIDDSTLAKKTIAVVTGLIMLLHLNNTVIF